MADADLEYRPIPEDRLGEFRAHVGYAFRPEAGPDFGTSDDAADQPGEPYGLFAGDELRCVCRHLFFRACLRDDWHDLAGLAAVATPPEHRRRGLVARLLRESLRDYRDRGIALSGLWPFEHPFYRRYGWETVNNYAAYECDPDALAFADDRRDGSFRRIDVDDWRDLESAYSAFAERYALTFERTERWWRRRVFAGWREDPYVAAWERDGEVRGYLTYTVEENDEGNLLRVGELTPADHEAYLHLLRYLRYHDSQVDRVRFSGPPDARLLDLADDPREIECTIRPGPMVRLVDVPTALEAASYPRTVEGSLAIEVQDPTAAWNDDTFRMAVEDGALECARAEGSADASVDVNTLSQLYAGYRPLDDLERSGTLTVRDPDARELLDSLFPERPVYLRQGF